MENYRLKTKIIEELEGLISRSCKPNRKAGKSRLLHQLLVKKHYNAAEVTIDYHRKRITMEVIADESEYHPGRLNTRLSTFRANLLFGNLREFLKSCVETDQKSLAFYAWLLRAYDRKEVPLTLV